MADAIVAHSCESHQTQAAQPEKTFVAQDHLNFDCLLSDDQIENIENNNDWGVNRRIVLALLGRTGKQLFESFGCDEESKDLMFDLIEKLIEHKKMLDNLVELVECSIARLLIVGRAIADEEERGVSHA